MDYKLIISNSAHNDFDEIITYITKTLYAPEAAMRLADAIEECFDRLKKFPFMFSLIESPEIVERSYRRAIVKNHVVVYEVDEAAQTVFIRRIFYGTSNYFDLI